MKRTNATSVSKLLDYIDFNTDMLRSNIRLARSKHKKISLNTIHLNALLAHVSSILQEFPVTFTDCPALLRLNEIAEKLLKKGEMQ